MRSFYRHTQIGTLMLMALVPGAVFCVVLTALGLGPHLPLYGLGGLLAVLSVLFSSLTVEITDAALLWHFGPGLWRYRIALGDIERLGIVRNQWWNGFGIRHGAGFRLYNVSGLDAIEIVLRSGERRRIGSDDAQRLYAALSAAV